MELGGHSAEREPRSLMDEALDRFDSALTDVITTIESGGLDQLATEEKGCGLAAFRNHSEQAAVGRSPVDRARRSV